jgi:hypothetical protein
MSYWKRLGNRCFHLLHDVSLAAALRGMSKELASRDAGRGGKELRWFTPEEAALAEALARIIVPSDEASPGIDEVCVLDPPAIVALDKLVGTSPHRQELYSRGLLSFDRWALKLRGCKFAEMPKEEQITLFRTAQQTYEGCTNGTSAIRKAWRRLQAVSQAKKGVFFAAQLYPQIRSDCLQVFYTSRVSWVWLEYDGPPMEKGYPSVTTPREP